MSCLPSTCNYAKPSHAFVEAGFGETVLLLHGSASSGAMWRKTMAALSPLYRVVAPDLIGYGKSAGWAHGREYSIGSETSALSPLLPCCNSYHLVGYSYGARAMQFFLEFWAGPAAWTGLPDTAKPAVLAMAEKIVLDWQASFAFDPGAAALSHIASRTFLIGGDESPAPMRRLMSALHQSMPGSDYSRVPRANHLLPLTHADEFTQLLLGHLHSDAERRLR